MRAQRDDTKPIRATPAHTLIAFVVVLIFLAPFILKFFFADSGLTQWLTTGMRVIWFYLLSYSSLVGMMYWVDNTRRRARMRGDI